MKPYLSKWNIFKASAFVMLLASNFGVTVFGASIEQPIGWPWHGVSISFPGGEVSDLVRYKKELNINSVRFHIRVNQYAKRNAVSGEVALRESLRWLDEMLDACKLYGIVAIVNYGQFPLGSINQEEARTEQFWTNKKNLDEVVSIVQKLVLHLKKRGDEFVAYDIISEPVIFIYGRPTTPASWATLFNKVVELIYKEDPERWIVIPWGAPKWQSGLSEFHPRTDAKIIWGAHKYKPQAFTHQGVGNRPLDVKYPGLIGFKYWDKAALMEDLRPLAEFQKKFPKPVFVGEFSAVRWAPGGEQYIKDMASIFDDLGWGWAYFSANGWHGWEPDYDNKFSGNTLDDIASHYIGESSMRWRTLRSIFNVKQGVAP